MKSEKHSAERATDICCNSSDAEAFWRERQAIERFNSKDEGVFVITLDNDRHFTGCQQIMSKVFRSPLLFADEVATLKALEGNEEFIVLHNRPGISPKPGPHDTARAREIALAAQRKNSSLLDYIIVGGSDDRFPNGVFSAHKRLARWIASKKP
ncbi:MAG TPA: JAB domain-containing protein [Verrucomicrobiae bacterium]|nr:JAB domain-containing protein [Verrucomicrobiae bacterium]